jgi:hypothetical protein
MLLQPVELMVQPLSLPAIKASVRMRTRFIAPHLIQFISQPVAFPSRQGTRSHAVLNALVRRFNPLMNGGGHRSGCEAHEQYGKQRDKKTLKHNASLVE